MDLDPQVPAYVTSDKHSFASVSAQDRWPIIITGAIDDVHRSTAATEDEEAKKEGKAIIEALAKLKYELQHDRQLTPIDDDGQPDVKGYNDELEQRGYPKWHNLSWLYAECYLYRRIATLLSLSSKWKSYDIFARSKMSTFKSSRPAVLELAAQYKDVLNFKDSGLSAGELNKAEEELFLELCEICLWGNATDLSLLTSLTYEDIQKLQGSKARKAAESNILVNDLPQALSSLKKSQLNNATGPGNRIDFILDNAGFELFVDLILAGYLLASGLARVVVLHPKSIPWFVSDVIPQDFNELLNALADPVKFYEALASEDEKLGQKSAASVPLSDEEVANIKAMHEHWSGLHSEGKLIIRPNRFWTHAGSYWRMQDTAPKLYEDLRHSDLVILKGDLNGRKLLGDVLWPPTTRFEEAIGPLGKKGTGLRILQLRTCKADTVVGLAPGEDERLKKTEGGTDEGGQARKWAWTGKWAMVQYHDGL
ncbi:MAG: hypothetical protein M1831_003745 [Alyxoria varia]|nr:MAG: hypothetical protein M1831_003745 [Alyxoria varia]